MKDFIVHNDPIQLEQDYFPLRIFVCSLYQYKKNYINFFKDLKKLHIFFFKIHINLSVKKEEEEAKKVKEGERRRKKSKPVGYNSPPNDKSITKMGSAHIDYTHLPSIL